MTKGAKVKTSYTMHSLKSEHALMMGRTNRNAPLRRRQQSIICMYGYMYGWMDESPHCGYLRPINVSDKNSTQPLPYFLMKKRLLLLTS